MEKSHRAKKWTFYLYLFSFYAVNVEQKALR